jgi:hypothetical protein
MNNWCICWLFVYILMGILIFKKGSLRDVFDKSFGVKELISDTIFTSVKFIIHKGQGWPTSVLIAIIG